MHRPTYLKIDLNAIEENYNYFKEKQNKKLIPVLKANAYGLGDEVIAKKFQDLKVEMIAVSSFEEAVHLRKSGITTEILILGYVSPIDFKFVKDYGFSIVTVDKNYVLNNNFNGIKVHLKIDTGMHRIGLTTKEEALICFNKLIEDKALIEGVMTHFFDSKNIDSTVKQFEKFKVISNALNYNFKWVHCMNSDAALNFSEDFSNSMRIGIGLFGLNDQKLKNVVSLYSKIVSIREIEKDETVGYNGIFKAENKTLIATLPIGYADGFLRLNHTNKVFSKGRYFNIVGNVCMDQLMVAIDENLKLDDEVEFFGEHLSLNDLAKKNHLTSYEYLTLLSDRVLRIYSDGDKLYYQIPRFKINLENF